MAASFDSVYLTDPMWHKLENTINTQTTPIEEELCLVILVLISRQSQTKTDSKTSLILDDDYRGSGRVMA